VTRGLDVCPIRFSEPADLVVLNGLARHMPAQIYLDYNATAPMLSAVQGALAAALAAHGNPSSVHSFGRAQRARVEAARVQVAALVGAKVQQVVFTSGGTEANNLALTGVAAKTVIVSAIEHDSILNCADQPLVAPVQPTGVIDLEKLETLIAEALPPVLVSVMLANNETGVIQPIAAVAKIVHAHGALLHCDAVQAIGRIVVDMTAFGIDLMTISAHKIGGPQGIGALIVGEQVYLQPQMRGGGQERGARAGTENVPGVVGFGVAAAENSLEDWGRVAHLREDLEVRLGKAFGKDLQILGREAVRLPNTCCVVRPGISAETQIIALDLAGIAVSAGSACSSGKVQASHVLSAMGVADTIARNAIRVSLGPTTSEADIDFFFETYRALRTRGVEHAA
jgi:cysteine desulfurase